MPEIYSQPADQGSLGERLNALLASDQSPFYIGARTGALCVHPDRESVPQADSGWMPDTTLGLPSDFQASFVQDPLTDPNIAVDPSQPLPIFNAGVRPGVVQEAPDHVAWSAYEMWQLGRAGLTMAATAHFL